ncbi:MAG: acetate--CoA ligase family protein [Alphaproteobacteria bacterium]
MPDLSALLWPNVVAVISASPDPTILRGRLMTVMMGHDFKGKIYPISRSHDEILDLKCHKSIDDVPEQVDLAILIIPAEFIPDTLEQCGKLGVRAAQILTSGFAEEGGDEGAAVQDEIRAIAKRYDMAVMGPNSEGFANSAAALCPTFSPAVDNTELPLLPPWRTEGHITAIAQSGGMGFAFYDHGRPKELPFNYIITTGNEACVEALDVVDYLLDEGKTDAFILFMEDVKNGARLAQVGEKALRAGKPIILTKIGTSEAGARAAASHTASLAGSYQAYQGIFQRYGIIEGRDTEELVDIAAAFSYHGRNLPKGNRVGICTASGGGGGWLADQCVAAGLQIPELDAATRATIDEFLPAYGTSQNPVDATAQAVRKTGYGGLARLTIQSPELDAVIVLASCRNPAVLRREREDLKVLAGEVDKPILFCSYTQPHPEAAEILSQAGFPLYANMRNCARATAELAKYRQHRERFLQAPPIQSRQGGGDVAAKLAAAAPVLCEYEVKPLLADYGIATGRESLVKNAHEAVSLAAGMDGPVVLKIQSPDVLHKTEAGGLALNLEGADAVRAGYDRVMGAATDQTHGVLVQAMAPKGHEMILGINHDDTFGPMLMVGFGGIHVEVNPDVALSPVPLDVDGAAQLLDRLDGRALLDGVRGGPAADVDALLDLIVKLSQFAADYGDVIGELDLNPVLVHEKGLSVVDALLVKRR